MFLRRESEGDINIHRYLKIYVCMYVCMQKAARENFREIVNLKIIEQLVSRLAA